MKTLLATLIFFVSLETYSQLTYVPDDVFEMTLETYFPSCNNGIVNDNYVLTAGIEALTHYAFNTFQQIEIHDLTGLESFSNLKYLSVTVNMKHMDTLDFEGMGLHLQEIYIEGMDSLRSIKIGDANLKAFTIKNCKTIEEIDFGLIPTKDSANFVIHYLQKLKKVNFSEVNFGSKNRVYITSTPIMNELTFGSVSDTNINKYNIDSPINLHCIQVSNVNYFSSLNTITSASWPIASHQPNNYFFSLDCLSSLSVPGNGLSNPEKKVSFYSDMLGRKVPKETPGVILEVYDNGTSKRVFNP